MARLVGNPGRLDFASEFPVRHFEVFRQDAGISDRRHEVGVASPARQDVHMYVIRDPGSRHLSQIHAEIEPFGFVGCAEGLLASLHQIHHLVGGWFGSSAQLSDVLVRSHHQVAADIRVAIKNNEIMIAPMNYEVRLIIRWILLGSAEDAGRVGCLRARGVDIFVPPGTPKYFHEEILRGDARFGQSSGAALVDHLF